jgi:hypothetical protein
MFNGVLEYIITIPHFSSYIQKGFLAAEGEIKLRLSKIIEKFIYISKYCARPSKKVASTKYNLETHWGHHPSRDLR